MKQWMIAGMLACGLAVAGAAQAQEKPLPAPTQGSTAKPKAPPAGTSDEQTAAAKKKASRAKRAASEDNAGASHTAPKQQPDTAPAPTVPDGAMVLGSVHIPHGVKADGKPLPPGTYQVRVTADPAKPAAVGTSPALERWAEFVQKGQVKGREVVTIVPQSEAKLVQKDTPPRPGGSKVETLKGGNYVRVWLNKGGNYYLVHLVS